MEMEHALPCLGAGVDHHAVAGLQLVLPRELVGKLEGATHQCRVGFRDISQSRNVCCGENQQVCRCLGIDVLEREEAVGLCDDVRR